MSQSGTNKKRRLKKGKLARFIFCLFSLLFFLFCTVFYGIRLMKYYRIYNPKGEKGENVDLLSTRITKDASVVYDGDGLYRTNGVYIFKGDVSNNYVYYSHMLWRILRINQDNSIELVMDEPINNLMWNTTITDYKNSDVHKYLNDVVLKTLNKDLLVKTKLCTDLVTDVTKITCNNMNEDYYVRLLNITDYVNSKVKRTYINNEDDSLWLSDRSRTKAWYAKGINVTSYSPEESFLIKPVVTLKMQTTVLSGKGTKENPYIVEKEEKKLAPGTYVKLGNTSWTVYETNKNTSRLVLNELYNSGSTKYRFDKTSNIFSTTKSGSLGYYLNTTVLNDVPNKEIVTEGTWYTGAYKTGYKDVYDKEVKAKVGLYNIADLKFNWIEDASYLLTPGETGKVYTLGRQMTTTKVATLEPIRPAIMIKNQKIKSGKGTKANPFELEV